MSALEDEAAMKELPYYKSILKSFLRKQIGALLEELAIETGEESIIVMANSSTGTTSCLSSSNAKSFIEEHISIQNQFLSYCLSGFPSTASEVRTPKTAKRKQKNVPKGIKTPKQAKLSDLSYTSMNISDSNISESFLEGSEEMVPGMSTNSVPENIPTDTPSLILGVYPESAENDSMNTSDLNFSADSDVNDSVTIKVEPFSDISDNGIINDQTTSTDIKTEPELQSSTETPQSQGSEFSDVNFTTNDLSLDTSTSQMPSSGTPQTIGPIRYVRKFPPKERTTLSLPEKITIIQEFESGEITSQRKLADKYNISKSAVADMIKNRQLLKEHYEFNANTKRKRFNTNSKFAEVNEIVWQWFKTSRENGVQMSGPMIQEKALQIAQHLQAKDFKGSNGWLHSWRNRYNVTSYRDESAGSSKQNYINDYSKVEGFNPSTQVSDAANAIMNLGSVRNRVNTGTASDQVSSGSTNYMDSSASNVSNTGSSHTDDKKPLSETLESDRTVENVDNAGSNVSEGTGSLLADSKSLNRQQKSDDFQVQSGLEILQTKAYEKIVESALSEYEQQN